MSKSGEKASGREQEEPQSDSVLDFLYCDIRRIGSFLAQFDDSGHLERVIQRESSSKSTKRATEWNVGGGATILGSGGHANLGIKRGPSEQGSESSERIYDPLWSNTRTFLDYLEAESLLSRDINSAGIGHFVLICGELSILDLTIMGKILNNKALKQSFVSNVSGGQQNLSRQARRKQAAIGSAGSDESVLGAELLSLFPMTVQAVVTDRVRSAWCTLRNEFLTIPAEDILLQHGAFIPGTWHLVGILDAKPDAGNNHAGIAGSEISVAVASLAPLVRHVLGRPVTSFGITPLTIFRPVSA